MLPPALVRRLLLDVGGYFQSTLLPNADEQFLGPLRSARERVEAGGCPIPAVETTVRYAWARSMLQGVVTEPKEFATTATDRIDRVLTHKVFGLIVFAALMLMVFQSVFVWARPLMDAIGAGFDMLGDWVGSRMPEGALQSLVVNGVIAGVGSVLQFLPQILILFTFIAILEDCGYMARAAYLMDRVMVRAGLSGRSFIPMLSSFACAVPGIMAARVIENQRDRLTTILVAPLLTCSARLPVYALLDRGLRPADGVSRRLARPARAHAGRALRAGNCRRRGRGIDFEADHPPRRDAALCDGTAQLQVAVAADGRDSRDRTGMDLPPQRRFADPGHLDRRLGGCLLPAQPERGAARGPRKGRPGGKTRLAWPGANGT